jgi:hypothetical protein
VDPEKPDPTEMLKAARIYLETAYDGPPPAAVIARLRTLEDLPPEQVYDSSLFEHDNHDPPSRYSLRLGNRFYPHMKLTIERRPDRQGFLFRADTHDRHCCPPPTSREYRPFRDLMEQNQQLAEQIERAWASHDLMTFKTWLRQDLDRRRQQADPPENG